MSVPHDLLEGNCTLTQLLRNQQDGLEEYVKRFKSIMLTEHKYSIYTTSPPSRLVTRPKFDTQARASNLIQGTQGIFIDSLTCRTWKELSQSERSDGFSIAFYPGVIMTTKRHDEHFINECYCPTAIRCETLDYEEKKFVIVGLPTTHGSIINDVRGTIGLVTCKFQSVNRGVHWSKWSERMIPTDPNAPERFRVFDHVVQVYSEKSTHHFLIKPNTELLLLYGDKFWKRLPKEPKYCISCCSRDQSGLITCNGKDCMVSRHIECFSSYSRGSNIGVYCPKCLIQYLKDKATKVTLNDEVNSKPTIPSVKININPPSSLLFTPVKSVALVNRVNINPPSSLLFTPVKSVSPTPTPSSPSTTILLSQSTSIPSRPSSHIPSELDESQTKARSDRVILFLQKKYQLQTSELVNMKADGSCIFYAFVYNCKHLNYENKVLLLYERPTNLGNKELTCGIIRYDVGDWIRKNKSIFRQVLFLTNPNDSDTIASYIPKTGSKIPINLNIDQLADVISDPKQHIWRITLEGSEPNGLFDFMPKILTYVYNMNVVAISTKLVCIRKEDIYPNKFSDNYMIRSPHCDLTPIGTVYLIQNYKGDHYWTPSLLNINYIHTESSSSSSQRLEVRRNLMNNLNPPINDRVTNVPSISLPNINIMPLISNIPIHLKVPSGPLSTIAEGSIKESVIVEPIYSHANHDLLDINLPDNSDNTYIDINEINLQAKNISGGKFNNNFNNMNDVIEVGESGSLDEDPSENSSNDGEWKDKSEPEQDNNEIDNEDISTSLSLRLKSIGHLKTTAEYQSMFQELTEIQISLINKEFGKKEGSKNNNYWFLPKIKQSISNIIRTNSSLNQRRIQSNQPAIPIDIKTSSERWCKPERIAEDFTATRMCCGNGYRDPVQFMKERIATRSEFESKKEYIRFMDKIIHDQREVVIENPSVELKIKTQHQDIKVKYHGLEVCISCFIFLHGFSRSAFHQRQTKSITNLGIEFTKKMKEKRKDLFRSKKKLLLARQMILDRIRDRRCESLPTSKSKKHERYRYIFSETSMESLYESFCPHILGKEPQFSKQTLWNAKNYLSKNDKIEFSVKKHKGMARCNNCCKLEDGKTNAQKFEKDKVLKQKIILETEYKLKTHLQAAQVQRKEFDKQKDNSMKNPSKSWCITFDGMDQAKTKLPSLAVYSKDLEKLPQLGVHLVGAFCFGCPVPIICFINFPNVSKDSNLSVTILERILNMQFKKLKEKQSKIFAWPEELHLTFDNTVAEAKNQFFFRFLGLLVMHGVFQRIYVNNLLVGHTHDIVDQMFSVFATSLRKENAKTLEELQYLLSSKYQSHIQGLVEILKNRKKDETNISRPIDNNVIQQNKLTDETADSSSVVNLSTENDVDIEIIEEEKKEEEDHLRNIQTLNLDDEVRPVIVLLDYTVNIKLYWDHWLNPTDHPLENIGKPHCFCIVKDDDGKVYLYNKILVDSTSNTRKDHLYVSQPFGHYSARANLVSNGINEDPYRCIPEEIDTEPLFKSFEKYENVGSISKEELQSLENILDGFNEDVKLVSNDCTDCQSFMSDLNKIGVIHQGVNSTEAEKTALNKQKSKKLALRHSLSMHLSNLDLLKDKHKNLLVVNWWTKWLKRVDEHITPSLVDRGILLDKELTIPYHEQAEDKLVSNRRDKALLRREQPISERIDTQWYYQNGPPEKGHHVVIRTNRHEWKDVGKRQNKRVQTYLHEPFWIGLITKVTLLNESIVIHKDDNGHWPKDRFNKVNQHEEEKEMQDDSKNEENEQKNKDDTTSDTIDVNVQSTMINSESIPNTTESSIIPVDSQTHKPKKRKTMPKPSTPPRTKKSKTNEVILVSPQVNETPQRVLRSAKKRPFDSTGFESSKRQCHLMVFDSEEEADDGEDGVHMTNHDDNENDKGDDEYNGESGAEEEVDGIGPGVSYGIQSHTSNSTILATVTATISTKKKGRNGKSNVKSTSKDKNKSKSKGKNKGIVKMDIINGLQRFIIEVHYLEYTKSCNETYKLNDPIEWKNKEREQQQLELRKTKAERLSITTAELKKADGSISPNSPAWLIEAWREISFGLCDLQEFPLGNINCEQCIIWGHHILTIKNVLTQAAYNRIYQDLTGGLIPPKVNNSSDLLGS